MFSCDVTIDFPRTRKIQTWSVFIMLTSNSRMSCAILRLASPCDIYAVNNYDEGLTFNRKFRNIYWQIFFQNEVFVVEAALKNAEIIPLKYYIKSKQLLSDNLNTMNILKYLSIYSVIYHIYRLGVKIRIMDSVMGP